MRSSPIPCGWAPVAEFAAAAPAASAGLHNTQILAAWSPDWLTSVFSGLLVVLAVAGLSALYEWRRRGGRRGRETRGDFARQLLEQAEAERKRVAQAIHDGLGHQLLVLKNAAAQAHEHPATDAALREQLEAISGLASRSLEQARGIAYRLRPFELDQLGLKAALEALVADVFHGTDLRVFKDLEALPEQLTPTQRLHLFRLVQEGLSNVIHHAHASTVMLEIKQNRTHLHIQIEDDGLGFDASVRRRDHDGGLGLARMETHAKAVGGKLELSSAPGSGTLLRITVPFRKTGAGCP